MKKRQLTIREYQYTNGTYIITLNNVGKYKDIFIKIKDIIRYFAVGDELFFGHFKLDGINISNEDFLKYGSEILEYFKINGKYYRYSPKELVVYQAKNSVETYEMMDKIFHYYLETILFCPKIDWKTFVDSYSGYMENVTRDYVINGYTDFLFSYVDSGDFSIYFDPGVYNPQVIREQMNRILF